MQVLGVPITALLQQHRHAVPTFRKTASSLKAKCLLKHTCSNSVIFLCALYSQRQEGISCSALLNRVSLNQQARGSCLYLTSGVTGEHRSYPSLLCGCFDLNSSPQEGLCLPTGQPFRPFLVLPVPFQLHLVFLFSLCVGTHAKVPMWTPKDSSRESFLPRGSWE